VINVCILWQTERQHTVRNATNRVPSHIRRRWSNGGKVRREQGTERETRPRWTTDRQNYAHRAKTLNSTARIDLWRRSPSPSQRPPRTRLPRDCRSEEFSWQKIEEKNADAKIKKLLYCHCNNNSIKIPLKCNKQSLLWYNKKLKILSTGRWLIERLQIT